MQGYTEQILKYAVDESHVGLLDNPDGTGEVGLTGDERGQKLAIRLTLRLNREIVAAIRFQVFGCGYTVAACAALAELCEGHSLEDISTLTADRIKTQLGGLPVERDYCASLANRALQAAIASVHKSAAPVVSELAGNEVNDDAPRINRNDSFYRALLETDVPPGIFYEDRLMFASLLTMARQENRTFAGALGLKISAIDKIFAIYFPGFDPYLLRQSMPEDSQPPLEVNPQVLEILLGHVSCDRTGKRAYLSELLARIIAARCSLPGHLWTAMGFFERSQLTAAIRRHLPTLAMNNDNGMRWKRYLFRQVCELNGAAFCKSPNCGDCSDYALCFAPEDEAETKAPE